MPTWNEKDREAHKRYMQKYRQMKKDQAYRNRKLMEELLYGLKQSSSAGKTGLVAEAADRCIQILQDPKVKL